MKPSHLLELIFLSAIWGASFMLMKETVPSFGVFALVEVRAAMAALCLLPLVYFKRQFPDLVANWKKLLFVGAFNTAIPFCLFSYTSIHLDAGLTAILNATAPMFGAVIAFLYLHERIGLHGLIGLLIGFFGVVVISQDTQSSNSISLLPVLSALAATSCYGIAACFMKKHLSGAKSFAVAAGSQVFAAILLLPAAIYTWPSVNPSPTTWMFAMILAVVCTGVAYIMYFDLIAKVGPSQAMMVGYLVPVFGICWGIIVLGESLSTQAMIGGTMIIFGVMITTGILKRKARIKAA
ncbi:DMT family transporter [Glaciecola sp. MH2013]|uniref:DMT family transporter n=1 Tax=Glaciecola sp. MH2013 TaxID=2785524 RepID=UPI00189D9C6D|nr:DMT family transporter [Glaciecola sp. MH2013]MBF7074291.1 DMT family transporter [Glaciecola sp. MH2013]